MKQIDAIKAEAARLSKQMLQYPENNPIRMRMKSDRDRLLGLLSILKETDNG